MNKPQLICLQPPAFTLAGILLGLMYYRFVGCLSDNCIIGSNPFTSMIYMGLIGLLLAVVFRKKT